jgi:mannose-6-phosphate isomerase-like protein (cupin superfamily)
MSGGLIWGIDYYDDPDDERSFDQQMATRASNFEELRQELGDEGRVVAFYQDDNPVTIGHRNVSVLSIANYVGRLAALEELGRKGDVAVYIPATVNLHFTGNIADQLIKAIDEVRKGGPFHITEILVESGVDSSIKRSILVFNVGDVLALVDPKYEKGTWFRAAFTGIVETGPRQNRKFDDESYRRLSGDSLGSLRRWLNVGISRFLDKVSSHEWCRENELALSVKRTMRIVAPSHCKDGLVDYANDRVQSHVTGDVRVRPWGRYSVVKTGSGHLSKLIEIDGQLGLSKQVHLCREERWELRTGNVVVRVNGKDHELTKRGDQITIRPGDVHQVYNKYHQSKSTLIEIQEGLPVLSEDDIIRFLPTTTCD